MFFGAATQRLTALGHSGARPQSRKPKGYSVLDISLLPRSGLNTASSMLTLILLRLHQDDGQKQYVSLPKHTRAWQLRVNASLQIAERDKTESTKRSRIRMPFLFASFGVHC